MSERKVPNVSAKTTNIKQGMHSTKTKPAESSASQPSGSDSKSANFEELFDSGYNSNAQSKTFIDIESDFESSTSAKMVDLPVRAKFESSTSVKQWTDSGVCITDSGLGIQEDDNSDPKLAATTSSKSDYSVENKDLLKIWLKQNSDGDTLLHLAIIEGLEDVACSIIRNTSSSTEMLNSYNYLYQTPLHMAVLKRQLSVIQLLIQRGVSLTFQDNYGNTPLHIACKYSLTEIVQLIVTAPHKATFLSKCLDIKNYDGDTCIQLAAYNNDSKLLEMLIGAGANVNVQEGKSGKSVLHWAVENLNVQLVAFLIKKCNADVNICTFANKTPLHLVWKIHLKNADGTVAKTSKIIKLLLEHCKDSKLTLENLSQTSESDFDSDEE